jgi:hypothetical protein
VIYPDDSDVVLLISEDARLEVGNKVTIIGWYVGGNIVIPKSDTQLILQSLALIFLIRSGDGDFHLSTKITDPSGSIVIETTPLTLLIRMGASSAQLLRLVPFTPIIGSYTVDLRINERVYHSEFAVTAQLAVPATSSS